MKQKTKLLADRLVDVISQWPGVECISLNEASLGDTLDPYFALILDVFHAGPIPAPEDRENAFARSGSPDSGNISAFESSNQGKKDRFLAEDLPVRIEFKSTARIEELVSFADTKQDSLWFIKDSGTYGFYRLAQGKVIFSRSGWIDRIRERLSCADGKFWNQIREMNQSRMEHFLNDLGAALYQSDNFFYLMSSSGFVKYACLTLFCINRRFEPSHRAYYNQVIALPVLPEGFAAQFESFLNGGADFPADRRYSLAQLIARGIVSLGM
ncbi:MAG: DUF4037 domain-containing protein [Spirochaetaceae bacterium]|jgi:hypothetical protein|nr:DUF4037 domain-containing protein [Spirochaetaceae bacterium]